MLTMKQGIWVETQPFRKFVTVIGGLINMYQWPHIVDCAMSSTYWNMIPLQLQYIRTILRQFDADSVHMLNGRGGQKYVVDLVDNLTSWVEVHTHQQTSKLD